MREFFFKNLTLGYMTNNIFFSNIRNQNMFLEKKHTPPFQVKWSFPNSWFICVNKLRKYDLREAYNYLDNPIKKSRWISLVKSTVNDHWCTQLTTLAQLYKGLQYLSNHNLSKCKIHPILKHRCYSSLDISRIAVKLRPDTCCKQNALSTTEMKVTQHACYAEQLKRMYYTSFSNVKNYSRRE